MTYYTIRAKDPSGEFEEAAWWTPQMPCIGESVMLPQDIRAGWQELSVVEVYHHPNGTTVWLGGTDGWDAGSVIHLFANARAFTIDGRKHRAPSCRR